MVSPKFDNPFTGALLVLYDQIKDVYNSDIFIFGKIVSIPVIVLIMLIVAAMWPFGILLSLFNTFNYLVSDTYSRLRSTSDFLVAIPMFITLSVYSVFWLFFAILSLPLFALGFFSYLIMRVIEQLKGER